MEITLFGVPRTKKNSQRFITLKDGRKFLIQNKLYLEYEKDCLKQLTGNFQKEIDYPIELTITIYKQDKRISDLVGYAQSIQDILVKGKVLKDDNYKIIKIIKTIFGGIDTINPRAEIKIIKENA